MNSLVRLREVGLKATSPRLKIVALFESRAARHLSAEDIFRHFLLEGLEIGQSTIYRTLGQLEQAGVIRKSNLGPEKSWYELNEGPHHDHLICIECGNVTEFSDNDIERHQEKIAQDLGFSLAEHSLSIYCHCTRKNCEYREAKIKLRIRRDDRSE